MTGRLYVGVCDGVEGDGRYIQNTVIMLWTTTTYQLFLFQIRIMENVNTGVLKKKEYSRSKDKAKKWYDMMYQDI